MRAVALIAATRYGAAVGELMAFEWVTVDGVFDADPGLFSRWFLPFHSDARAACIRDTIEGASALLLGRRTYDMLAPFWSAQSDDAQGPATALNAPPKHVASTTLREPTWQHTEKILATDVEAEVERLKNDTDGYVLVPGSATLLASLLQAKLVDSLRLLVHPYLMGEGRRWAHDGAPTAAMELVRTEPLELGVVQLDYRLAG